MSPLDSDGRDRMVSFFSDLIRSIEANGGGPEVAGLGAEEIESVRVDQHIESLPMYYEEFLRNMGRCAGQFLIGTDAFYPEMIGIKHDALELLAENGASHLIAENAIVFAMHQGYQVYWLEPSGSDDPPVAMYQEGSAELHTRWDSFSEFLADQSSRDLALAARNDD
ncbi:SMI1/KNR4 family protein [Streptomyces sp. NPDC057403]|uniref:SMI1/KNR4 family protein n=1 Tax=Streptomyces sp. NPDC057403 TaxID=3346119 RepID=UPI003685258B